MSLRSDRRLINEVQLTNLILVLENQLTNISKSHGKSHDKKKRKHPEENNFAESD